MTSVIYYHETITISISFGLGISAQKEKISNKAMVDHEKEVSKAKSRFIDYVSHETRNSLCTLVATTEHYLRQTEGQATATMPREDLHDMFISANMATAVVTDILTLEKIEKGMLKMEYSSFSISKLVDTVKRAHTSMVDEKGVTLSVNEAPPSSPDNIIGDMGRINQILSNFLSNAIKFTNSTVNISWRLTPFCSDSDEDLVLSNATAQSEVATPGPLWLTISVQDNGEGIGEVDGSTLFRSFVQLRAGKMQAGGGSGLGLAICKELAKLHGGDVGCESTLGVGSTFTTKVRVSSTIERHKSFTLINTDDMLLENIKVLFVDDQAVNLKLLVRMAKR